MALAPGSLLSRLARFASALSLSLIALALLRLGPVYAETPLDVRALPLVPWLLVSAVLAALSARPDPSPMRGSHVLAWGLLAVFALLASAVALRGPVGLAGELQIGNGLQRLLAPGPIDATQSDMGEGRGSVVWDGPLRAPETGTHRLWVEGRGRVELKLDDRVVLAAEGEQLRAGVNLLIGRGSHRLALRYDRTGDVDMRSVGIRGHRLRLGWIRPRPDGSLGRSSEWIAPRYLGAPSSPALWRIIDMLAVAFALLLGAAAWSWRWERPARVPTAGRMSRREWVLSIAGYAAVLIAMSWPLVTDLAGHGIGYRADGQLSLWIMAWDVRTLLTNPSQLFEAPIFHPAKQALAFSENMLLPAVLAAPFTLVGGAVLGYNVVFLLGALGSGIGVQLLVRRASGDGLAAFVAGVLFAAGALRWARILHMHEQFTPLLPLILLALDRFWEERTLRRALWLGVLLALQVLASIYLGVIVATLVGLLILFGAVSGLRRPELLRLALGLSLAGVLVAPLLVPYLRMRERYGAEWSLAAVEPHSLTLPSYLASGTRLYSAFTERHMDPELRRRQFFPGIVPLALGIAGLASAPRRHRAAALLGGLSAIALSLGPESGLYRWMYDNVILFRGLRGVFRFAVVPILMLTVLSGFALAGRRRLAIVALAFGLVEAVQVPLRLARYSGPSEAAKWLAGKPGVSAFLPLGEGENARAMLDGIPYFPPLLNGYSSFTPPHYPWLPDLLEIPLSEEALRLLRSLDVRHVVTQKPLQLSPQVRFGETVIYAVPEGDLARAVACPTASAPAVWDESGVALDLGAERAVSRVVFEIGDGVPEREPELSLSSDGVHFRNAAARFAAAGAVLALAENPRLACAEIRLDKAEPARFVRLAHAPARPGGRVTAE